MTTQDLNSLSFDRLVPSESTYLAKDDVGEDGIDLTVRGFKRETVKGDAGDEQKIVLYFAEPNFKPMILNKTNANRLAMATGVATAGEARGKKVNVYCDPMVEFGRKDRRRIAHPQAHRGCAQAGTGQARRLQRRYPASASR